MTIFTLVPKASFHVGEPAGSERARVLTYIPADTLFAAIVTAWARLGRVAELLPQITEPQIPPFTLTSAFPCLLNADKTLALRLYPRPLVKLNATQESIQAAGKPLRQANWVSERLFTRLCQGDDVTDACKSTYFAPGGVWIDPEDVGKFPRDKHGKLARLWSAAKDSAVPHVALDRVSNVSQLYHVGRVTLAPRVGLWFAARGLETWHAAFSHALNFLSDAGLGGLRSTGHGAFAYHQTAADLPATSGARRYAVTLSRYAPRNAAEAQATLQAPRAAYKLKRVGGWCVDDHHHSWLRRQVTLVTEGSILGPTAPVPGCLVDVAPHQPTDWQEAATPWPFGPQRAVYRWGYAFTYPIASRACPQEVPYA